jgi:selenocysteine lyase/cysteine desulfurase
MHKRTFLKGLTLAGMSLPFTKFSAEAHIAKHNHLPLEKIAGYEDFWAALRADYVLQESYINLESGYYNILPQKLLNKYIEHIKYVNSLGAYYMRTVQFQNKKRVAAKLATLAGCDPSEIVITRNTTESLDTIIAGFKWQAGDEAVMAVQDYGAMLDMFREVATRHGVVNKIVSVPLNPSSDEEIVALYKNAITPKTKLLLVSHVINISGQVMPIRKICDMAHTHGVKVLVDGAHAFAQLVYTIPELHCDFYGASLHKWLSSPLGAGILYISKENQDGVWPLIGPSKSEEVGIAKFNHTGTHPVATDLTIEDSIEHYKLIGPARKQARLKFLQQYWTEQIMDIPGVVYNTPKQDTRICAIANVGIKGMPPATLAKTLFEKYKIYTVGIDTGNVVGCRITPNVFTTTKELDQLVAAIKELAAAAAV